MSRRHGMRALAAATLAVLLVTGCADSEVDVPPSLVSGKTVGGTPVGGEKRAVASAGPDDIRLLSGPRASETATYERTTGGVDELVQIGAWERAASLVDQGTDYLSGCLDAKKCHSEPLRFDAARLDGQPEGTIAFSSVLPTQKGRVSIKRSFTYLQPDPSFDGTLVMVSIERRGHSDPSTEDLLRLTEAQVSKTRAQLTKAKAQSS